MLRQFILVVFCAVCCTSLNKANSLRQTEIKDLRAYEKSSYTIAINADPAARRKLEAKVREFVWEHWHNRRLGFLSVRRYSKEGEPSTSHFFIESKDGGAWQVRVVIKRIIVERRSKHRQHESVTYDAYVLERFEKPESGQILVGALIPESEVRTPDSYFLALKEKTGRVLTII